MRIVFFFISVLIVQGLYGQTVLKKSIIDPEIDFIEIDATNCFDIELQTTASNEMQIEAKIDGEYHKDLLLNVVEAGSTIQVSAGFRPNFISPNDKLSAHKVVSIALQISIPAYKTVVLNGTSCNVLAKGDYKNLAVSLNDGLCALKQISAEVEVRTQSGDILIETNKASIQAESKYGTVEKNTIPLGDNRYQLMSVTGNIRFIKTD